jgi:hypothetical protein
MITLGKTNFKEKSHPNEINVDCQAITTFCKGNKIKIFVL